VQGFFVSFQKQVLSQFFDVSRLFREVHSSFPWFFERFSGFCGAGHLVNRQIKLYNSKVVRGLSAPPWETGKTEPPHNRDKGKGVYHYADE
jgi:hypothetical protein